MILDWNSHCYKIHKTKKLSRTDPSDNKSVFSQEAHYIKFLSLRGLTYKDIYFHWVKIKNGVAATFKDDPDQQVAAFFRIYKTSENISESVFKDHYAPIRLYKSEIEFLNKVKAPVWVRQYWLAMLIYWKFASQHQKRVPINSTLCNWAMRQTNVKDAYFGHHQDEIAKFNRLDNSYVMCTGLMKGKRGGVCYWFDWIQSKDGDEEYVEVKNLDKMKKTSKLITGNRAICPCCGKEFVVSSKQHTDLCPHCYTHNRKDYVAEKVRAFRKKQKSSI